MPAKQTILNRLAKDDLEGVFEGLFSLADKYKDEQLRNSATFQSGRLKALEKERVNDSISQEEDHLQTAKIRKALIQIAKDFPDDWTLDGTETSSNSSKVSWKKYIAYFTGGISLLAGIAELSGYSVRDFFKESEPTEIPAKAEPPSPKVSTTGDNSPAVITNDGDVNINYGEIKQKEDTIAPVQK